MARAMMYLMGTSGAETLSAAANVFMGQTEAPLIVKPYVPTMTQSELLAMMVGGMATISGGIMAVYISMGPTRWRSWPPASWRRRAACTSSRCCCRRRRSPRRAAR